MAQEVQCEICDKVFMPRWTLAERQRHFPDVKPEDCGFACNDCFPALKAQFPFAVRHPDSKPNNSSTRDNRGWTNPLSRESCASATAPSEQQVCWSAAAVDTGSSVSRVL
jgi:hypothetical protein